MLLSRNTGDPTVDGFRDKKESCSTRKGLRVGTGFKEIRQTPRGRGFSLLGFILCLRTMLMLELVEAMRGRLIGPKNLGPNCLDLWNLTLQSVTAHGLFGCLMV